MLFFPSLVYPYLDIDELIWGEFANSVVGGCPPYVCVIGEKPPLLYLFYSGVFALFGRNSHFAVHWIHLFWLAGTAFLLNRIEPGKTRRLPGFIYLLLVALPNFRTLGLTGESLMNPFLILSCRLALMNRSVAGILVGFASLFRHQAAIVLVPLGWIQRRNMKFVLRMLGGFLLVWLAIGVVMWLWGSLDAFLEWSLFYNFGYIRRGATNATVWKSTLENGLQVFGLTFPIWILAFRAKAEDLGQESRNIAHLYLGSAILAAATGLRFYPHYFIQAFPPLAWLAGMSLEAMFKDRKPRLWRVVTVGALLGLTSMVLVRNVMTGQLLETNPGKDYAAVNRQVGEYIRERSEPSDRIFVWGWGHGIYYFADRQIASRYVISDFLTGKVPGTTPSEDKQRRLQSVGVGSWETFFEELERERPKYFVNTSPAGMHGYDRYSPYDYGLLSVYLERRYFLERTIEGVELHRRREVTPESQSLRSLRVEEGVRPGELKNLQ